MSRVHTAKYWHCQKIITFFEFTSTNTDIIRELLPNNSKHSFQGSSQIILTLSESFFHTVLQNKIFLEIIANHTDIFRELLLYTTGHALLNTFKKKILNHAIFNESGKTKKSEKLGTSGQLGTL